MKLSHVCNQQHSDHACASSNLRLYDWSKGLRNTHQNFYLGAFQRIQYTNQLHSQSCNFKKLYWLHLFSRTTDRSTQCTLLDQFVLVLVALFSLIYQTKMLINNLSDLRFAAYIRKEDSYCNIAVKNVRISHT